MTAVLLFIVIVIGLNCIPQLTNTNFLNIEKTIFKLLVINTLTFLIFTVLLFYGYKLQGAYSNSVIGSAFILASLLFFSLVENTRKKIIIVLLLTPLILLSLFTFVFGRLIAEYKITDAHKIEVSTGGPLACGEIIEITETEFGIFDRRIHYEGSLCLREIKNIEMIKFNKDTAQFLIYHNGEMDSENPYHYTIDNKNVW